MDYKDQGMVDAISKCCEHPGCSTTASYGLPKGPMSACARHRKDEMLAQQVPPEAVLGRRTCLDLGTHAKLAERYCEEHYPLQTATRTSSCNRACPAGFWTC